MENQKTTLYTAEATATGGRQGHIKSADGVLDMPVGVPGTPGANGKTNPEQLFAAGYAACFQSALLIVARMNQTPLPDNSTVTAQVDLDKFGHGAYGLAVRLVVDLKGMDPETGRQLVEKAHQISPYSVGVKDNVKVELQVV